MVKEKEIVIDKNMFVDIIKLNIKSYLYAVIGVLIYFIILGWLISIIALLLTIYEFGLIGLTLNFWVFHQYFLDSYVNILKEINIRPIELYILFFGMEITIFIYLLLSYGKERISNQF